MTVFNDFKRSLMCINRFVFYLLICSIARAGVVSSFNKVSSKNVHEIVHEKHYHTEAQDTVTHTCPEGYWFENGVCLSKTQVQPVLVCPPGTIQLDDSCLQVSPLRHACPEGGELVGLQCLITSESPKGVVCPSQTFFVNGECEFSLHLPPSCPEGTFLFQNNKCARIVLMQYNCPAGFTQIGSVCSKTETIEPSLICPEPMVLQDSQCVFVTSIEPLCSAGTVQEGNQCVTYKPKLMRCPVGFSLNNGVCMKSIAQQRLASCTNGANPNEECKIMVPVAPSPVCPRGTERIDDDCVKRVTHAASLVCPPDYMSSGNRCRKVIEYDCSSTVYDIVCEESPIEESSHDKHQHESHHLPLLNLHEKTRGLTTSDKLKDVHATTKAKPITHEKHHDKQVSLGVLPICHKVPMITPKTCEKIVEADATPVCPDGTTLKENNQCELITKQRPVLKCGGRSDSHGNCFVEETSRPLFQCPQGYLEDHTSGTCNKIEASEHILECPFGTSGPHCAIYSPKVCPGGSCEKIIIEPQVALCPEGYFRVPVHPKDTVSLEPSAYRNKAGKMKYNTVNVHIKGGMSGASRVVCRRMVYVNQEGSCPVDSEPLNDVSCIIVASAYSESRPYRFSPEYICPEGYAEKHNERSTCVMTKSLPATPVCPHDSYIDSGRCSKVVQTMSQCVDGSVSDNKGDCWVMRTAEAIVVDTVVETLRKEPHHQHYY